MKRAFALLILFLSLTAHAKDKLVEVVLPASQTVTMAAFTRSFSGPDWTPLKDATPNSLGFDHHLLGGRERVQLAFREIDGQTIVTVRVQVRAQGWAKALSPVKIQDKYGALLEDIRRTVSTAP